jgi:hypothetical protein
MHKVTVTKQIGNKEIQITVEGEKPKNILKELGKWSFPGVSQCRICKKDILELQYRHTDDGFDYVFVKCLSCGAELTFGEKKTGDVIYLRTNDQGKPDWKELKKGE